MITHNYANWHNYKIYFKIVIIDNKCNGNYVINVPLSSKYDLMAYICQQPLVRSNINYAIHDKVGWATTIILYRSK